MRRHEAAIMRDVKRVNFSNRVVLMWWWVSLDFGLSDFSVHGREFRGEVGEGFLKNMEKGIRGGTRGTDGGGD